MDVAKYISENMVVIPNGQELIRDFVDPAKWLSSDYKMSAPGTNKEKLVKQKLVDITSFLLLNTAVTNELYSVVMNMEFDIKLKDYPVVNVSWIDAVKFCNNLSEMLALEKCYTLNSVSEKITVDVSKDGFRLPTDGEWQFACRGGEKGYRYGDIDEIAWFEENSNGSLHQVKTGNGVLIYMMKVDMETIVFSEVAVLQARKELVEPLQGERAFRILE